MYSSVIELVKAYISIIWDYMIFNKNPWFLKTVPLKNWACMFVCVCMCMAPVVGGRAFSKVGLAKIEGSLAVFHFSSLRSQSRGFLLGQKQLLFSPVSCPPMAISPSPFTCLFSPFSSFVQTQSQVIQVDLLLPDNSWPLQFFCHIVHCPTGRESGRKGFSEEQ